MPTLDDRIYALISRYTELTTRNELDWQTTQHPDRFWADVPPDNAVSVESSAGGYPYTFTIYSRDSAETEYPDWAPVETIHTLGPADRVGPWVDLLREGEASSRRVNIPLAGAESLRRSRDAACPRSNDSHNPQTSRTFTRRTREPRKVGTFASAENRQRA